MGDIIRTRRGGNYKVRDLRLGGMGLVYFCVRIEDGTLFVLKTLSENHLPGAFGRFLWEAEVWVKLGRHRNIVQAHGTSLFGGGPFVVIEYIVGDEHYGPELSGWIRKGGLSIPLALDFACQFCSGMIHAKEVFEKDLSLKCPFVHRDIKPQNILVTRDRVVKVTDFGLVKAFEKVEGDIETDVRDEFGKRRHSFTKRGGVCGTFPYIAPEIWLKMEPDERADIYSFGCVLYEMFYGIPPFVYSAEDQEVYEKYRDAHLNLFPRPIRGIPEGINEVILRSLSKGRGERYEDFKLLRDQLVELYYGETGNRVIFMDGMPQERDASDWLKKGEGLEGIMLFEEAVDSYTRALEINPNSASTYINRARALETNPFADSAADFRVRQQRAISDYDEAIRLDPKDAHAYMNRGDAYYKLGEHERAFSDYDEAIRLDPKDAHAYMNRGDAYYKLGEHERAFSDYDEVIRLDPKDAHAYMNRGNAYYNLGQYERAISDYDEVIRLDAKDAHAYMNRGNAYYNLGQYERAFSDYDEAIRLDPKDAHAYMNRGNAYCNLGQYERAISDYDEVIRLDPKDAHAYMNRGNAYCNFGQYERAISDYDEAIRLDPKDAHAYMNRGDAYYNLGQYERAISDYDEGIKLDPKDAHAYMNRGGAYYNLGQYERAISDYDEGIKLDPKNASWYYIKALCFPENPNKGEEALRLWEGYLQVAKDDPKQKESIIDAKAQIKKLIRKKRRRHLNPLNLVKSIKWRNINE
jgi:tetratricopeptide (TPR) repeat protein